MTIAVTGAAGFLGRSVAPALATGPATGRLLGIDRVSGPNPGFEWVLKDIRDPHLVDTLAGTDVVVHLAAVVLGDMRLAEDVNVRGTRNVAEAAARAGCKRFVHASSVAAYGFGAPGRLLTEEDPLRPLESFPYSRTKGAAERELDEVEKRHPEMEIVRLRPSIVLGPNTHELAARLTGRLSVRPGRRAHAMQYVHIDDVVEAFRLAALSDATGAFNVSPSDVVTYEQLASIAGARLVTVPAGVARLATRAAERFRPAMGVGPGWVVIAQRPPLVSSEKAERVLDWRPKHSGREAVEEFVRLTLGGKR